MNLTQIFANYTPGSTGFYKVVDTHCGFYRPEDEISRIAIKASQISDDPQEQADEFSRIRENESWWVDRHCLH